MFTSFNMDFYVFSQLHLGKEGDKHAKPSYKSVFSIKTRTAAATTADCFSEVKCKKTVPFGKSRDAQSAAHEHSLWKPAATWQQ